MTTVRRLFRAAGIAGILLAALAVAGCANKPERRRRRRAPAPTPGSQQDFVVNVGDRVFFEADSSELTPQSLADAGEAGAVAAGLQPVQLHHRRPRRRARHARIQHRARRAPRADGARISHLARCPGAPHAHDFLRQRAAGRGLQRSFVLVAEPARRDGAQHQLLVRGYVGEGDSRRLRAPVVFWAAAALANGEESQHRDRPAKVNRVASLSLDGNGIGNRYVGRFAVFAGRPLRVALASSSCRMRRACRAGAVRLRRGEPLRGAAAAGRDRHDAGAAARHALSRGDRQHRRGQHRQPGRARRGLRAGDQVSGRRVREGGHVALHHRARALQAQARTGAGLRGRREGGGASTRKPNSSGRKNWSPSRFRPRRSTTSG